jgi:hypothetical protein
VGSVGVGAQEWVGGKLVVEVAGCRNRRQNGKWQDGVILEVLMT